MGSSADPASALVIPYVAAQIAALRHQGERVRRDAPDSVHRMRVAVRRLTTVLTAYRSLVQPEARRALRAELAWLSSVLAPARDAEVMGQRLADLAATVPAELLIGPVAIRIDERLRPTYLAAHGELISVLDGERHARLLDELDGFAAGQQLTPRADRPAKRVILRIVDKEQKRLRRAAEEASASTDPDKSLHDVRKGARRLRYAAEVAEPLRPRRVARLVEAAKGIQRILGDQHDSVVARATLIELGREAEQRGESAFTYGRMHALEEAIAAGAETDYLRAWEDFPSGRLSFA